MDLVIWIFGGKVNGEVITERFEKRLDRAIEIYEENKERQIAFVVSGRSSRAHEEGQKTESSAGSEYLQSKLGTVNVIKEDVSCEFMGNMAFSKPILKKLNATKTVGIVTAVGRARIEYLDQKIIGKYIKIYYEFVEDELSVDEQIKDRDRKALMLTKALLHKVTDGDDCRVRDLLMYDTPYYFKGLVLDKWYFDKYWEGGFEDFLEGINKRNAR